MLNKIFRKDKKLKLECCQNNLDRYLNEETETLFQNLIDDNQIILKEFTCLSHCKLCKTKPYGLINNEMICADDMKSLIHLLNKQT